VGPKYVRMYQSAAIQSARNIPLHFRVPVERVPKAIHTCSLYPHIHAYV